MLFRKINRRLREFGRSHKNAFFHFMVNIHHTDEVLDITGANGTSWCIPLALHNHLVPMLIKRNKVGSKITASTDMAHVVKAVACQDLPSELLELCWRQYEDITQ